MENEMSKIEFVKEVERLVQMTSTFCDLNITYGWLEQEYSKPNENGERCVIHIKFHPSDRDLNRPDDEREMLRFRWGEQSDEFCVYQSVEADNFYGILIDTIKALRRL